MQEPARDFEKIVHDILVANGFAVTTPHHRGPDLQFDFTASLGQTTFAVEVKYYRTARLQTALIRAAALSLTEAIPRYGILRGMLVVSCTIGPDLLRELEHTLGLTLVDRNMLLTWATRDPDLLDRLSALLERAEPLDRRPEVDRSVEQTVAAAPVVEEAPKETKRDRRGIALCDQLHDMKPGRAQWARYESHCAAILQHLFPNDLRGWHRQTRTDDGLNRFDFVCRIQETTEFWRFLVGHLQSRYVLFEFKNYADKIKQGQILTTEKYLLARALRRVGIIFTREGADEGAHAMMQGAIREHGKLMLVLSDKDVCEMLRRKDRGDDPSDYLFDRADEFLMSLPR
jgi:hypothetical protein